MHKQTNYLEKKFFRKINYTNTGTNKSTGLHKRGVGWGVIFESGTTIKFTRYQKSKGQ